MNKQNSRYYYLLFFLTYFLFQSNSWAQIVTKSYTIPTFSIRQIEYNDQQMRWLTFEDAITTSEYPTLPAFWERVEVNHLFASYKYTLSNAKYEPLTTDEIALIPSEYTFTEPKVEIKTATDKNQFFAVLSVIPIVKNANGHYQRLVSCDIRFEGVDPIAIAKRSALKNSVLATGTWYKIAVNNTGLYKVTYNDLKALGIPMSGLRSSSIALFGNGGGAIPDINPLVQIDDLFETPIMMMDNGNDVFDEHSYFVFYAQGPHTWEYNTDKFTHKYNIYSDQAYYFINIDPGIGEKKRVEKKSFAQPENRTVTSFIHYDFYEKDVINFMESGREWFDEAFYASSIKTYNFTLPELYNDMARVKIRVATTSTSASNPRMDLFWGKTNTSFNLSGAGSNYASATTFEQNLSLSSGNLLFTLKYNSNQSSAAAYLDYIEIQAKCKLIITNDAMPFTITENIDDDNISLVKLEKASAQTMIWDVTEHNAVYAVDGTLSGTQFSFKTPMEKNNPRRFIAFNGTTYNTITPVGKVANQNLHGFRNVEMVIVTHPNFLSEANRLAEFRAKQNNITVEVVTLEQVYNEFSSGAQDLAAIRNFMRYLYDNDSYKIQYLLLFGRPSYDYRGRVKGTQLFVPNYQGLNSFSENALRSCDDFFGVLGANQGNMSNNTINIAVGRFPVLTMSQAKTVVDKTINASARHKVVTQNASQISNFGDWRNMLTLVADDKEYGLFVTHAESAAKEVLSKYPSFNLDKIYSDAFPVVSYAGGQRYPDVTNAINKRMEKGTLAISYMGHGGGNGWAHERILEIADINRWKNKYNQPLMITITCSFGWYDKQAISPAELAFLNDNGGISAAITTSRVSYANETYGKYLFDEIGKKVNGRYQTMGEIHRIAKNRYGGTSDHINMVYLMGDPAMIINVPNYSVKTDEIIGEDLQKTDTIKALTKITVKGRVTDDLGNTLNNFNGNVYPSIFDKTVQQKTLGQDKESPVKDFMVQKNIVFKGNATVTNGFFEFSFFVPKDINFEYGKGKISYYAASENEDAGSYYDNFIIGGVNNKPIADDKGPEIQIYLNDDKFVPGGISNPDPVLILKLKDEYGINTTGNGIGHDLVAILDNDIEKQIILNDFFLADQDSYNSGTVRYFLEGLTPGNHTLKARAWDIFNNPSETSIDFVVKSDEKLQLAHVLNYPNPFTTSTRFYFEHNQPGETFDILIHIFTVSGKLVNTIQDDKKFIEGNRYESVVWDGRDQYGDKIGKGVYLYRLTVRNSQGETVEKIEKIAIL